MELQAKKRAMVASAGPGMAKEGRSILKLSGAVALCTLLLAACLVKRTDSHCPQEATCSECIGHSGCGYCNRGAAGACMAGTSYGPDEADACPDSAWRFTDCDEPPAVLECAQLKGCSVCLAAEGCGFCHSARDCRAKDHAMGCELETDSSSVRCQDADCRAIADCGDCARQRSCGFCLETMSCRHESVSSCTLSHDPDSLDCSAATCRAMETCRQCAEHEGCGWCMDEASCWHRERPGSCELEVVPDCSEADCRELTSCADCLETWCSWCDYFGGFCTNQSDTCPDEYTMAAQCPPDHNCNSHEADCNVCVQDSSCGFCHGGIRWRSEYYSGCLVVDGTGQRYGSGSCDDFYRPGATCPQG